VERLLAEDLAAVHTVFDDYLDEAEAFVLEHLTDAAGP